MHAASCVCVCVVLVCALVCFKCSLKLCLRGCSCVFQVQLQVVLVWLEKLEVATLALKIESLALGISLGENESVSWRFPEAAGLIMSGVLSRALAAARLSRGSTTSTPRGLERIW